MISILFVLPYFCAMHKQNKLKSLFLGSLFSLLIPLGAYLYLKFSGHDGHMPLPKYYGIARVDSHAVNGQWRSDTIYRTLQDIKLCNQLHDTISICKQFPNKIFVFHLFTLAENNQRSEQTLHSMQILNKAFKKNDTSVRFISLGMNPTIDTVVAMRNTANKFKANHDKWIFGSTPDTNILYQFARNELGLTLSSYHTSDTIVLVDKYRNIRGYYNASDSNNVRKCAEDIAYLIVEKNKFHERKRK